MTRRRVPARTRRAAVRRLRPGDLAVILEAVNDAARALGIRHGLAFDLDDDMRGDALLGVLLALPSYNPARAQLRGWSYQTGYRAALRALRALQSPVSACHAIIPSLTGTRAKVDPYTLPLACPALPADDALAGAQVATAVRSRWSALARRDRSLRWVWATYADGELASRVARRGRTTRQAVTGGRAVALARLRADPVLADLAGGVV